MVDNRCGFWRRERTNCWEKLHRPVTYSETLTVHALLTIRVRCVIEESEVVGACGIHDKRGEIKENFR